MKIIHLRVVDYDGTHVELDWAGSIPAGCTHIYSAYAECDYEGHGHALLKFGRKGWAYKYLGHCSCYGPLDDGYDGNNGVPQSPQAPTLAALTAGWTAAALAERRVVLEAAGWKAVRA